jgi:hypothetical protein
MSTKNGELSLLSEEGMEYIKAMKQGKYEGKAYMPKKKILGSFGFVDERVAPKFVWVVNLRKDRRHGVVDVPEPLSPYGKNLLEGMFKNWD